MTIDPTLFRLQPSEVAVAFEGASVVQVVNGDPAHQSARIERVQPAIVSVSEERVCAVAGEFEWAWLTSDIRSMTHGASEPWTIFDVPGIHDFGVMVPVERVAEFRRLMSRLPWIVEVQQRVDEAPQFVASHSADADGDGVGLHVADTMSADVSASDVSGDDVSGVDATVSIFGSLASPIQVESPELALAGLHARGISAWFGSHNVLDRVSLDMPAGQVTALIGPSGCGKSTFLRILNRMHEMIPSAQMAGEVLLDGHDIYDPNRKLTDARREIGMVFQKPNPFPAMSIYDNVLASLRLTGTKATTSVKDELVERCLTKAGLWTEVRDRLRKPGGGLSGGQQQRLCIARALAIKPRVLLMDEPCSALDPTSTRRIEETIIELASEVTIVIVTHNMQQAARVSNQCAFFLAEQGQPGVIVEHGPTDAMFSAPQDSRTFDYVNGRFG